MGCDIHLYAETVTTVGWMELSPEDVGLVPDIYADDPDATDPSGGWRDGGFYDVRDYDLFGRLAGVRRDDIVLFACRGLPADVSRSVAATADYFGSDGHHHSWLTIDEAATVVADDEWHPHPRWTEAIAALTAHPELVRIVFWFDN